MVIRRVVGTITSLGVLAGLVVGAGLAPAGATVTPEYIDPAANPPLNAQCGLDFGLVLDSSGSIGDEGIQNLKDASTSFVESLADTGSTVSVTSFSTQSPGLINDNPATPGTNLPPTALTTANLPTIEGSYNNLISSGWTNWQDGLLKSQDGFGGFTPDGAPDLIIFITDGNPNTTNTSGAGTAGLIPATNAAITIANEMKTNSGVHMFGIAVGGDINLTPIQKVTSEEALLPDGSNFSTAGYTETDDYASLAETLKAIAVELCAPSLTINKVVTSPESPEPVPADGWTFKTTVTIPDGSGKWVNPGTDDIPSNTPSTKSQTTEQGGAANFQWEPDGDLVTDPVIVEEVQQPGYEQQPDLVCTAKNLVKGTERDFTATLDGNKQWNLGSIDARELVSCTATNESRNNAQLKLVKQVEGKNDPNDWTLTATGPQGAPTSRTSAARVTSPRSGPAWSTPSGRQAPVGTPPATGSACSTIKIRYRRPTAS